MKKDVLSGDGVEVYAILSSDDAIHTMTEHLSSMYDITSFQQLNLLEGRKIKVCLKTSQCDPSSPLFDVLCKTFWIVDVQEF